MENLSKHLRQPQQHISSELTIRCWGFVRSMLSLNSYVSAGKTDNKETWGPGG